MKKIISLILSAVILCTAAAAQAGEAPPVFGTIREALDSAEGYAVVRDCEDCIILLLETENGYYRIITLLDDHAKELYRKTIEEDYSASAREALENYAWALPPDVAEKLPEAPKDRTELDSLTGKTVRELMNEGFGEEMIVYQNELEAPVHINLEYGFYTYEFEVNDAATGDPDIMTVRSGKFIDFSRAAFEIDVQELLSGPQHEIPE